MSLFLIVDYVWRIPLNYFAVCGVPLNLSPLKDILEFWIIWINLFIFGEDTSLFITLTNNWLGCLSYYYSWLCWIEQVADFGLSREEMVDRHAVNIRGTFGYLDPEYISTKTFTKKSDVYSFGVLLFELIAGRNPQQGLMEYVQLVRSLSLSLYLSLQK